MNGALPESIIVIASSAGGIEALQEILPALPVDLPAAVIVVQHTATSMRHLASLLGRRSRVKVRQARPGERLRAGHVYLAAPDHHLVVTPEGRLELNNDVPDRFIKPSADHLFASAASGFGSRVIGVVISGTGQGGAAGVRAIKRGGGVVIVQEPSSTRFRGMPGAAVLTGVADHVLPASSIAEALIAASGDRRRMSDDNQPDEAESLLEYLALSRGFDVTAYKRTTLLRRVQKRMAEVGAASLADYQDRLQVHPDEFVHLFNTILINVTSFFRDGDQWDYLSGEVLPQLLSRRSPDAPIRVWSAGCASGQEAYSVAMLLAERLGAEDFRRRVKIYATDVDEEALGKARSGSFTPTEVESVAPELRAKYFDTDGSRFIFRQDLRRSLIFGHHDLVQDAPISRVDLLLCRNTLMYFTPEAQSRILNRLHYALSDDGYLFLGKAEMLLTHAELFQPVDMRRRVFTKVPLGGLRERFAMLRTASATNPGLATDPVRNLADLAAEATPYAQLLISEAGMLAAANAKAREWFGIATGDLGRPFQDLEVSYRPVELRSLIERAPGEREVLTVENLERLLPSQETLYLDVAVIPLREGDRHVGTSVVFSDVSRFRALRGDLERSQHELETAYEELQSTNEELETTNEELESTIEELETTNEELQSSNEELETMNEELESTNAELQAINQELRDRTDEIDRVNSFMASVLGSLQLGVIVVDRKLEVQMWNSRSEELWGIRTPEVMGQALTNVDIGLPIPETLALVKKTLAGERESREELRIEAVNRRGRRITCRVVSSRVDLDQGDGVVLLMEQLGDARR